MGTLLKDIRYGLRGLWRNPAFTAVAVFSLALGVGANTAVFSLVHAVLLRPLALRDADRLVMVWEEVPRMGIKGDNPAPANYADWKEQSQSFEEMAVLRWQSFNLTGDGDPERVSSYGVTHNLFPMIGARPALGRTFTAEEDVPGGPKVVMMSQGLWRRRYGADPGIVGRDIQLNGEKYTVVGVMPRGFQFLQSYIGLWVPAALSAEELRDRDSHYLTVVGRLREGVTPAEAQADVGRITERIAAEYPDQAEGLQASVVPIHEQLSGGIRRSLLVLLGAVGLVLLIACANIANLLLARAATRRREMAVRTALGASRWRIARQLLTESVLLASLGGVCGALLAAWSFEFLKRLVPDGMALTSELRLDSTVLLYAAGVSVLTGIVFGLAPALNASRVDLGEALKQAGGRTGLSAGGGRLRGAFVVAETALALILLVGAGLLVQTVNNLRGQYDDLKPAELLTARTVLSERKYAEPARRWAFYDGVLERVKALPGVVAAGYSTSVPLQWKGGANGMNLETDPPPGVAANAIHRQVSPEYLQTMNFALREGRYLEARDDEQGQPVVVVNETMARQFWPGQPALGRRIQFPPNPKGPEEPWRTVVGVVGDVREMGADAPVKAEMYLPYRQMKTFRGYAPRDLVVRTKGDPHDLVAAVRREVQAVDADQPVSNVMTMEEVLDQETNSRGMGMTLLLAFAGLALVLAVVGLYGVLAYFVAQHTPEIGVRLALGARPSDILRLVLGKGMALALGGVALGGALAFLLTRLMSSLLYGIEATDPKTFAAVALLLTLVALAACYLPARRATKVDPMEALRYE